MAQLQVQVPVQPVPPVPVSVVPIPVTALGTQTSLYVGDLDPNVTEGQLFEVFSTIGPVISIRVCRDINTKRSLGYAYVNFSTSQDASRALDVLNFSSVNGKPMRIMFSHRDPSIRKSGAGNIYVKYLDKSLSNKALYDAFAPFGTILSCKVSLDSNGQSRGFGFVQFEKEESAKTAIAQMDGANLDGTKLANGERGIYVCPFVKRQERDTPTGFTNVYVKNLSETTTEEDLKEIFGTFGTISSAVVMRDGDKPKGFGFVNFEKPEDAAAAVAALNAKPDGDKEWFVGRAMKKSEREAEIRAKQHERKEKFEGVNLYLKNLEDVVDDEKLKELFQGFGTVTSCKVMRDPQGHSKGSGFVAFGTAEEANRAKTEMNGRMVGSKPIYVAFAQKRDERRRYNAEQAQFSGYRIPMSIAPTNMQMFHPPQVFYNQHAPAFPPQHAGFAFQQQMMPNIRPGGPQIPFYSVPLVRQPQPQQRPAGRRPQQPLMPQQQQQRNRNLRYTPATRNPSEVSPPPLDVGASSDQKVPITALLASSTPDQARMVLGEHLYPLVENLEQDLAGKVTGMLLEMDQTEVLHLIESPDALKLKVGEALEVLNKVTKVKMPEMAALSINDA